MDNLRDAILHYSLVDGEIDDKEALNTDAGQDTTLLPSTPFLPASPFVPASPLLPASP